MWEINVSYLLQQPLPLGCAKNWGAGKLLFHQIWHKTTLMSEEKAGSFDKIWKIPSVFLSVSGWIYQASCNLHFLLKTIIGYPAWK